jgi:acid phosphatase
MPSTAKPYLYAGVGVVLLAASFAGGYATGKHDIASPGQSPAAPVSTPPTHELIDAVLYQKTAAEYRAVAWQAYRLARENLDRGLADPSWSACLEQGKDFAGLPPAVILDLDETALDSTDYESRVIRDLGEYTQDSFHRWCEEQRSGAIPGAREFLDYALKKGVKIFYTTGRTDAVKKATRGNLERLGYPLDSDTETVLCNDGTSLSERRRKVAVRHRVVLELGDNLDDFTDGAKGTPAERLALVEKYRDYWGSRWVILPNAMYGFWEAALYGFDYKMLHADKLRRKMEALQP